MRGLTTTCSVYLIYFILNSLPPPNSAQYDFLAIRPSSYSAVKKLNWTDCGGESAIVKFKEIKPDHYPFKWGRKIHMTAEVEILQDVMSGIRSVASIGPLPFTRNEEIPCLADNFGSCNTDLCEMIEAEVIICEFLQATGNECVCPLKAGNYRSEDFSIALPSLPPLLRFFANRPFWAKWYWLNPETGDVVGCLSADLHFRL